MSVDVDRAPVPPLWSLACVDCPTCHGTGLVARNFVDGHLVDVACWCVLLLVDW